MPMAPRPGRPSRNLQRSLGVLAAVAALGGASLTMAPGVHASATAWCSNPPDLGDYAFVDEHEDLKVIHIKSLAETFVKSDGDFVNNLGNPSPITGHFSVTEAHTTQLSTTTSMDVTETATAMSFSISTKVGFSQTIMNSWTTTTGKTVDFTVPANTYMQVDYGIRAWDVVYDLDTWEISDGLCWYKPDGGSPTGRSPHGVHVVAPTQDEGFRFSQHT
jgi:hypothetical protein